MTDCGSIEVIPFESFHEYPSLAHRTSSLKLCARHSNWVQLLEYMEKAKAVSKERLLGMCLRILKF